MTQPVERRRFADPVDADAVAAGWRRRGYSCQDFVDPAGRCWEDFSHPTNEVIAVVDGRLEVEVEGARLLRLSPAGRVLMEVRLPVRCPTMPCFGDDDLRTLYVTTARQGRPEEELAAQPWAGRVLRMRVEVPGLPVNFAAG